MKRNLRIAVLLNDDFSLWHFFQGLLRALVRQGHEVYVLTPAGPYAAKLEALGAIHVATPLKRFVDPWGDLRYCFNLARIFRKHRIDLACNITIKPIVYGALAGWLARVPQIVGMIEGLGYTLAEPSGARARALNAVARLLYWVGCRLCHRVGFSNPDDLELFVKQGFIHRRNAVSFRSMVGVDTAANFPGKIPLGLLEALRAELRIDASRPVVAMITRVVWSKGVREFVEASAVAHLWSPTPVFLLVGPVDPGAVDSVPANYIKDRASAGLIWLDHFRDDVAALVALSDVVVLPSFYREGVPRILLEALAFGKPVVTTDHVGCRETVRDGSNGFLVPVNDSAAFADAVKKLVESPTLREEFGRRSRQMAETDFAETRVVERVITRLFHLEPAAPGRVPTTEKSLDVS